MPQELFPGEMAHLDCELWLYPLSVFQAQSNHTEWAAHIVPSTLEVGNCSLLTGQ
jgi:hypothetical protein